MFKPFEISRRSDRLPSFRITVRFELSDEATFFGRKKFLRLRTFVNGKELFPNEPHWVSPRITREQVIKDFEPTFEHLCS